MIKKPLVAIVPVLVIGVIGVFIYNYLNSVNIELRVPNTTSVVVKDGKKTISTNNTQDIDFRAPKFTTLTISFEGKVPYESSTRTLAVKDKSIIHTIKPYYAKQELQKRADNNSSVIKEAITTYNPKISTLYSIKSITAYHFGEWVSADLVWKGEYSENSDTLRVVLRSINDSWNVVAGPDIILFRDYYKEVPLNILEIVNNS